MFLSRTTRGDDRLKPSRVLRCDLNMDTGAHASVSHANSQVGIPKPESSVSINPLGCNIHDQMRGYIRVTDTPFAGKTDQNGYVTLSGMAGGAARLTVWHPALRAPGNETASAITVTGGAQTHKFQVALR